MTGRKAIETIMKDTGTTQLDLARFCGMKYQSSVSEAFKRDMKISLVAKFAEAMGYNLVLQKKDETLNGQIVIDGKDEA